MILNIVWKSKNFPDSSSVEEVVSRVCHNNLTRPYQLDVEPINVIDTSKYIDNNPVDLSGDPKQIDGKPVDRGISDNVIPNDQFSKKIFFLSKNCVHLELANVFLPGGKNVLHLT